MTIKSKDWTEALEFLNMQDGPVSKSRTVQRTLEGKLPPLLDEFFDALSKSPVAGLFSDPERVEATKSVQYRHWLALFEDQLSEETAARSLRTGEIHAKKDLSTAWYITAYGWMLMKLVPEITKQCRLSRKELNGCLNTLIGRFFSDMAISLTGYEQTNVELALCETRSKNVAALGNLAKSVSDLNGVALQLALLQNNAKEVAGTGKNISAASSEMVTSVGAITATSNKAAEDAEQSSASVAEGRAAVDRLSHVINNISDAVNQTSRSVDELSEASDQIGQMLSVIEGIAQQTNLLALNATIEAARAGEAGKGFAVVASEVKQLATQTAKSTEDIAERIAALRNGMALIQENMSRSTAAVSQSEEAIVQTSAQMELFSSQVTGVSENMGEIACILNRQRESSAEVAKGISSVADLAADSHSFVGEVAKSMRNSTGNFVSNALDLFDDASPVALCHMAKIDHVVFKQRVVDTCMGKDIWASNEVPDHHGCRLGKWYDRIEDADIRSLEAFSALVIPHKTVHAAAKKALEAAAAGHGSEMTKALKEMDDASVEVLACLEELSNVLTEQGKKSAA
ncbi:MAG: hypothetical protein Tsb0019_00370 [Roseibium sp.]